MCILLALGLFFLLCECVYMHVYMCTCLYVHMCRMWLFVHFIIILSPIHSISLCKIMLKLIISLSSLPFQSLNLHPEKRELVSIINFNLILDSFFSLCTENLYFIYFVWYFLFPYLFVYKKINLLLLLLMWWTALWSVGP